MMFFFCTKISRCHNNKFQGFIYTYVENFYEILENILI